MDPTPEDDESTDKGQVLSPDELDFVDNDSVATIDDGRFVIAPEGKSLNKDAVEESLEKGTEAVPEKTSQSPRQPVDPAPPRRAGALDDQAVKRWLERDVKGVSARYGFRITSKTENAIGHQQMFSDDVGTVFDGLLMWYAQQLDRETPVEDVLGILLMESNVRVRFPVRSFTTILKRHDLQPEDSISDLFNAMYDGTGIIFPPERTAAHFPDE